MDCKGLAIELRSAITLPFNEIPMSDESAVCQWFSSCQKDWQNPGNRLQVTGIQRSSHGPLLVGPETSAQLPPGTKSIKMGFASSISSSLMV